MSESIYKVMKENKFEIVNEINRESKCNICNELIIKACSAPCGCCFCSDCIEQYLNGEDKFCPGTSRRCQMKMINYANDIVIDIRANVKISEIVKCPRQNCEFEDELEMIANHMRTCDKRPISCPFNAIGCKVNEVMNDEMKAHLNEDNYCHSKLLIDLINNLLSEMESMKNEIIEVKRENNQFKQQSINQQQKICEMESNVMENWGEIEQLNEEMAAPKDDNRRLRSKMETNAQSITAMRQEIGMTKTKSQHQIDELRQNQQQQLNNEVEMLRRETNKLSEQNANGASRVDNNDGEKFKRIIGGEMNDLELRMTEKETRLINAEVYGEFEWKIENLSQQERGKRIHSKPFYSGPDGYKMCLSVNINDNLGIFAGFHLMQGDSDDKLEWPFKFAVTIDVIDTANGNIWCSKTIKYSDWPDDDERMNPANDINQIFSFYDWSTNRIQWNSPATRNNQLHIKCRVEREK